MDYLRVPRSKTVLPKESLDFSQPWEFSDVILEVERTRFHVHRSILAMWSLVFSTMFTADFKEKTSKVVTLKEKKSSEIEEMLLVIYPISSKPVTEMNYSFLLDLAREFIMKKLTEKCEEFLTRTLQCTRAYDAPHLCIELLAVAEEHGLESLQEVCIRHMITNLNFRDMKAHPLYDKIHLPNYRRVVEGMIANLEEYIRGLQWEQRALQNEVRKLKEKSKNVESQASDAMKRFESFLNTLAKVVNRRGECSKTCACLDALEGKLDAICSSKNVPKNDSPFSELRYPLQNLHHALNQITNINSRVHGF